MTAQDRNEEQGGEGREPESAEAELDVEAIGDLDPEEASDDVRGGGFSIGRAQGA